MNQESEENCNDNEHNVEQASSGVEVSAKKLAGRKKRVIGGYKIGSVAYGLFALIMLITTRQPFYSAGPLVTSGVSYIMIGAAENDQLKSDTYKRLNIALIEYGLVGFIAGMTMKLNVAWKFACFVLFVNSIKGYGYGLKGWELGKACAKDDMISGMKYNLKAMFKIPNIKSAGYLAATLTVGVLKLRKLAEVLKISRTGGGSYILGTRLFSLARMMVLTIVMFTLKDAADRDRLEGTTFIELNALASISFALWAAYLSSPIFGIFSAFTTINMVSSIKKKN